MSSILKVLDTKLQIEDIYSVTALEPSRRELLLITKAGIIYSYNDTLEEILQLRSPLYGNFKAFKIEDDNYWISNNLKVIQIVNGQVKNELPLPS